MKVKKRVAERVKRTYLYQGIIIIIAILIVVFVSYFSNENVLLGPVINERIIEGSYNEDRIIARDDGNIYINIFGENSERIVECNFFHIFLNGGNDYVDLAKCNGFDFVIDGGEGDDEIYSSEGHDRIKGGGGSDVIKGGGGNDDISGGLGIDKIFGEGGNDLLRIDSDDNLDGGDGENIVLMEVDE